MTCSRSQCWEQSRDENFSQHSESSAFFGPCHSCSSLKGQSPLLRMLGRDARYWYDCCSGPQWPLSSRSLLRRRRKPLWGREGCRMQSCPGEDNRLSVSAWSLCTAQTTELPPEEKLNLSHIPIPVLWLHLQRSWPAFCHHGNLSCCQCVVCVWGWYLKAKSQALLPNYQLPGAIALLQEPGCWCFKPRDKRKGKRWRKEPTWSLRARFARRWGLGWRRWESRRERTKKHPNFIRRQTPSQRHRSPSVEGSSSSSSTFSGSQSGQMELGKAPSAWGPLVVSILHIW